MLFDMSVGLLGGMVTGVSGIALGSLLSPSIRDKVLPQPQESKLSEILQFHEMGSDQETLLTKDGQSVQVIRLKGLDQSAKTNEEIQALLSVKQGFLDQLLENEIQFKLITTRRLFSQKTEAHFEDLLLQKIHETWTKGFEKNFANEHYLIFASDKRQKSPFRRAKKIERGSSLRDCITLALEALEAYSPQLLTNKETPSSLLSFWGSLLAREKINFKNYQNNLSEKIVSLPVSFDEEGGLITYEALTSKSFEACLTIKAWGEETRSSILRDILSLPFEITLLHQIKGIPRFKAGSKFSFKKGYQLSTAGKEEIEAAKELIQGEETSLCSYQLSLFIKGSTKIQVEEGLLRIQSILRNYGMVGVREREALEWVWRCQFPGYDTALKPCYFLSYNLSHFINLDFTPTGLARSDWGEGSIRDFKTASGGVYAFQFHVSEEKEALAHSLMIAPTGSGKTTLIQHLIGGALRHPDFKAFIFDRLQGTKIFTQSVGGTFIDLSTHSLPLNPFVGEDTSYNRLFLTKFLLKLSKEEESADSLQEVSRALDLIYQLPSEKRILSSLFGALFGHSSSLKKGLSLWAEEKGVYFSWFNGMKDGYAYDALSFDGSRVISFEMEHIQEDPYLAGIMTDYIFYKIRSSMMNQSFPHFIFVDEAKAQVMESDFKADLEAALNQQRKLRGAVCLAFQSPEQMEEVGLTTLLTTQCPTYFLFPNPGASEKSYNMFSLTEAEWSYIKGKSRLHKTVPRSVLIKRQNESVILDIDLKSLGPYLKLYKSGNASVQLVNSLQSQFGEKAWVMPYLEAA